MEKEIWKDIDGYVGLYQVSSLGRVKNVRFNRFLNDNREYGYARVELFKDGKGKHHSIHRLVATAFVPNPHNLPCVNHKDENKRNNRADNLEWCSHSYNNCYGTRLERVSKANTGVKKDMSMRNKKVLQYSTDGTFIKEWESITSIGDEYGFSLGNISQCCNGKYKTANGYIWKFKRDVV